MLLPYMDEGALFNSMNFEMHSRHAANTTTIGQRLEHLQCPSDSQVITNHAGTSGLPTIPGARWYPHNYAGIGSNHGWGYCGRHGSNGKYGQGVFSQRRGILEESGAAADQPMRFAEIRDGTSNTSCFAEVRQNLPTPNQIPTGITNEGGRSWGVGWYYGYTLVSNHRLHGINTKRNYGYNTNSSHLIAQTIQSNHEGGAFVAFNDGAVRFMSESVSSFILSSLGSPTGNEIVDDEEY